MLSEPEGKAEAGSSNECRQAAIPPSDEDQGSESSCRVSMVGSDV